MNITRIKKALQRSTHLTSRQLYNQYPEFMKFCAEIEFEEELKLIRDRVRARVIEPRMTRSHAIPASTIEEGYEEDSLPFMSARQTEAIITQELEMWG